MNAQQPPKGDRFNRFQTKQVLTPLLTISGLFGLLLVIVVWAFNRLRRGAAYLPENSRPILLIFATLALLIAVATLTIVFARLGLSSWRTPLGLPTGSVQAVIALLLILLFFITAVFLYADIGRDGEPRRLRDIDDVRLSLIATEQILELAPSATGAPGRYDVTLTAPKNEDSRDIAKQLVTTVSTLVVAVAAFYFGSRTNQPAPATPPAGTATTTAATRPEDGTDEGTEDDDTLGT